MLIKRSGGGGGFESSYLTLHKKRGSAFKEIFTDEYFKHSWSIDEPEKFVCKYYATSGGEPPLSIVQYGGELARDYIEYPKHCPDFVVVKGVDKPLKIYKWDQAKFEFVAKK